MGYKEYMEKIKNKEYIILEDKDMKQFKINDNIFRVTTPILNKNNDFFEFYIIKENENSFLLTDDGLTMEELDLLGFDLSYNKEEIEKLNKILLSYGITLTEDNQLSIRCTKKEIECRKYDLIQCMAKVKDMFYFG